MNVYSHLKWIPWLQISNRSQRPKGNFIYQISCFNSSETARQSIWKLKSKSKRYDKQERIIHLIPLCRSNLLSQKLSVQISYIQAGFPFGAPLLSPSTISFTQNWCKFSYIFFHCWTICMHLLLSSFSLSISISAEAEPCCWKWEIFLWEINILKTLCAHKNVYAPTNLEISSLFHIWI